MTIKAQHKESQLKTVQLFRA